MLTIHRLQQDKLLEKHFLNRTNVNIIINAFERAKKHFHVFDSLLEPFTKLISTTPRVCKVFAENVAFTTRFAKWVAEIVDPRLQKTLLTIIQKLFQNHSKPSLFLSQAMVNAVKGYAKNSTAAVVKTMASSLLIEFASKKR